MIENTDPVPVSIPGHRWELSKSIEIRARTQTRSHFVSSSIIIVIITEIEELLQFNLIQRFITNREIDNRHIKPLFRIYP